MEESIIGFFDESAPQTTANTARLWSFRKPEIIKDTSKYRANTFGFYSLNGNSVVRFQDHSKKENIILFLKSIRESNPEKPIMVILDNFRSHHSKAVKESAESLNIKLIFLPPYSPSYLYFTKRSLFSIFVLLSRLFISLFRSSSTIRAYICLEVSYFYSILFIGCHLQFHIQVAVRAHCNIIN